MILWKNLVVALVAAFVLAACSSSNDNDTTPTGDGEMSGNDGPADPAIAERMAINDAIAKASAAVNALDDASTDAQVTEAEELVDAAADAIADAGNVPAEEKLAHNQTVDEIEDNLDRATMSRTAAIDRQMTANAATAEELFKGLAGNFAETPPEGALNTLTLMITPTYGKASKVETSENAQLAETKGMSTDSSGSWSGTMVEATGKAIKNTDTVMVYTDVEKDKQVDFKDVFELNAEGYRAIVNNEGSPHIMAAAFELTNAPKVHGDTTKENEIVRIPGTYAGAHGDYVCTETGEGGCTSQGDADGHVQLAGTWVFDPDSGAKATMKDDSYASFGWWLRIDSEGNYFAAAFHSPDQPADTPFDGTKFAALTGKAVYVGPAVGKYAIETGLPSSPPSGGHFNATATLTANFEENVDEAPGASISGMVNGFDDGDWTVEFAKSNITSAGAFGGEEADAPATWTIGQTKSFVSGTYEGNLSNQDDDGLPGTATGTWQVQFASGNNDEVVGRMIGAFGAKR